jgi:hypothetical protein
VLAPAGLPRSLLDLPDEEREAEAVIAAIFDRDWVHPWRRPAEKRRSVRLSAPAIDLVRPVYDGFVPLGDSPHMHLDDVKPPRWPDTLVFGQPGSADLQAPKPDLFGLPFNSCPCGATWYGEAACWYCGPRP